MGYNSKYNMKVKVDRLKLLDAVEKRAKEDEKKYEVDLRDYEKEKETYAKSLVKALESTLEKAKKGNISVSYNRVDLKGLPDEPNKPRKPDHTQVLNTLKIAVDDTIVVNTQDYSYYLS